jgi:hypothetical protein
VIGASSIDPPLLKGNVTARFCCRLLPYAAFNTKLVGSTLPEPAARRPQCEAAYGKEVKEDHAW